MYYYSWYTSIGYECHLIRNTQQTQLKSCIIHQTSGCHWRVRGVILCVFGNEMISLQLQCTVYGMLLGFLIPIRIIHTRTPHLFMIHQEPCLNGGSVNGAANHAFLVSVNRKCHANYAEVIIFHSKQSAADSSRNVCKVNWKIEIQTTFTITMFPIPVRSMQAAHA